MMVYAAFSQLLADHSGQGAAAGFGNIVNAQLLGIFFVAGAQRGYDGDTPLPAADDQIHLAGDQVNGIHHKVIICQEQLPAGPFVTACQGPDLDIRINVLNPLRQHLGLWHPQGRAEGAELPVDVCHAHAVLIQQGKYTHAGAGQGFGTPGAYTAQAKHGHVAAVEFSHGGLSKQHTRP